MIDFDNIFLTASGYDYFWQYGVLHRLTEETGFDKVQNVYANSGGMAALSYVNARHFSLASLKEITEWWEEYGGKPRSMEWWVDNLVAHKDPNIKENLYPKNYFVGVSTIGGNFRWEKFCPQDASTYKHAVATAHIPGVTMAFNIKQVLSAGIDGHWGFNPDIHLPPNRERTLVINALGIPRNCNLPKRHRS